ncbi:hypothetical protein [Desulfovibrio sp. JC010]|uniref:hypothetical protein n=1 Tax=Desulfovibrio sp. JC010 TaxID=2593641 RepID=UPI0013D4E398|nr:hypothetical protein [Desulfovibrio sp. JC010]NDV26050.1 hypothetical protein [Desulfovibrio sp. JC010]
MSKLVDLIYEEELGYSPSDCDAYRFITKPELKVASQNKPRILPGSKKRQGQIYHYAYARALASIAKKIGKQKKTPTIALLFRDCDGSNTAENTRWEKLISSMEQGFAAAEHKRGVAMIPKPKSEAWLLCCKKETPSCESLEEESGNDASPNSLKKQLEEQMPEGCNCETLFELAEKCWGCPKQRAKLRTMSSFKYFEDKLRQAIRTP